MFIVFKKNPKWYLFWKDAEYSIAPFDVGSSSSGSSDPGDFLNVPAHNEDVTFGCLPVFMINIVANLDVDEKNRLRVQTVMDCNLVK
jgi:hypothetical protein